MFLSGGRTLAERTEQSFILEIWHWWRGGEGIRGTHQQNQNQNRPAPWYKGLMPTAMKKKKNTIGRNNHNLWPISKTSKFLWSKEPSLWQSPWGFFCEIHWFLAETLNRSGNFAQFWEGRGEGWGGGECLVGGLVGPQVGQSLSFQFWFHDLPYKYKQEIKRKLIVYCNFV